MSQIQRVCVRKVDKDNNLTNKKTDKSLREKNKNVKKVVKHFFTNECHGEMC